LGSNKGLTVLGKWVRAPGEYIRVADEARGTYFSLSDEVRQALGSDAGLEWAVNREFLNQAITRGDRFLLSSSDRTGTYLKEITHILKQGYQEVEIDSMIYLVKGGS